jgi:hypothetical protein
MNFEDIKNAGDLQKVSKEVAWQNFERLTAFIFEENNFQVETSKVKTSKKKRRQYDVIANVTNENAIPIIVTLIEEEILFCDDVPIVPILKLNSFINDEDKSLNPLLDVVSELF